MINLTINQKPITAKAGQTILQAAREAGLYIPTLCYLTKVSPIASCRLCVVEVEGENGFVLSCQTPVKEGLVVQTDSPALFKERQHIMAMYDVNHPLECGVCDKSGECDLQNKTTEFQVDTQPFAAKEMARPIENWGFIQYDPSLCILCERCTRVCNEVVGDNRLAIAPGGYKSKITWRGATDDRCAQCGECMAVCPVGALVSQHFKNQANAWELKKIPSTCAHCSGGCAIEYEVRHVGTQSGSNQAVFRVGNDVDRNTLCGAGRFGYGFENSGGTRDREALDRAIAALGQAKSVRFTARMNNEELLLLQRLKECCGVRLVCDEAYGFSRFLSSYTSVAAEILYDATSEQVASSDAILVLGSPLADEAPLLRSAINHASLNLAAEVAYLHPIDDPRLDRVLTLSGRYEVGTEEGVAALLVQRFISKNSDLPPSVRQWLDQLDEGYLSAETNLGEEELLALMARFEEAKNRTLIVGSDLYNHPRAEAIAKLIALLRRYGGFSVLMVPPATNALGVALICELDEQIEGFTIGIDAPGDFTLGSMGLEVDLALGALSQQEGTLTTLDKRVMPLNVAVAWEGWSLGDLFAGRGVKLEWLVDLTPELPASKGYPVTTFDRIDHQKGEALTISTLPTTEPQLESVAPLGEFNGTVIYHQNPASHPTALAMRCEPLKRDGVLRASAQFALAAKIADGDRVLVASKMGTVERVFELDMHLKGTVALLESFDLAPDHFAQNGYRYETVQIKEVGA